MAQRKWHCLTKLTLYICAYLSCFEMIIASETWANTVASEGDNSRGALYGGSVAAIKHLPVIVLIAI